MTITKEQEEHLVLLIQGAVCLVFLGAALRKDLKERRKIQKKIEAGNIRREEKLAKQEYKWKKKLLKEEYQKHRLPLRI